MSRDPVPARIDGLLARDTNVAVIFRRGPSKRTQLLRWNLDTDEIVPGQWIGGKVYTRRCDLSHDGALLVGAFTNYSQSQARQRSQRGDPDFDSWTAVSRPPYFTALAIWEGMGAWNLGGIWQGPRALGVNLHHSQHLEAEDIPAGIALTHLGLPMSEDEPIYSNRLETSGWQTVQPLELREKNPEWRENRKRLMEVLESGIDTDLSRFDEVALLMENTIPQYETVTEGVMEKRFTGGRLIRVIGYPGERWEVRDESDVAKLAFARGMFEPQWLDVDDRGRVIYGDAGCLWAWADFPKGTPQMIADLNANRFEPIAPPDWAQEWPSS